MQVLVTGASGGIGGALVSEILHRYPMANVVATWHRRQPNLHHDRLRWHCTDLTAEEQVASLAMSLDGPNWIINAAGMLHHKEQGPEKSVRHIDSDFFLHNMRINALPTLLLAKHFNRRLAADGNCIFASISARVGSIGDNRLGGWSSYRCAKAALNMAIKNISIEWSRTSKNIAVVALHPGTTDTRLSEPFQAAVKPDKLFPSSKSAGLLIDVLEGVTPQCTGQFLAWDGSQIPW